MMLTINNLNRHEALTILRERIDFSNDALSIWKKIITHVVQTHSKPICVTHALIILCEFIGQQPPCQFKSPEGQKIASIIKQIYSHQNPISLAQAITLLKGENVKLTEQESSQLSSALIHSPDPLTLIRTIHNMVNNDTDQCMIQSAPIPIPVYPTETQKIIKYSKMWEKIETGGNRVTHTIQEDARRRTRSKTEEEQDLLMDVRTTTPHSI